MDNARIVRLLEVIAGKEVDLNDFVNARPINAMEMALLEIAISLGGTPETTAKAILGIVD